jgi:hypothetical protein
MTTRNVVTHFGGASSPLQPNGIYLATIAAKTSNFSATVTVPALGVTIGPCRAVDGLTFSVGSQVLCTYIDGLLDDMVIIGTLKGV